MAAVQPCVALLLLLFPAAYTQGFPSSKQSQACPQLYRKVFWGCVPRGNVTAGTFKELTDISTQKQCVRECCLQENCNVAFMTDNKCYHIACITNQLCVPYLSPTIDKLNHVSMVLVRPTNSDESWGDVLDEQQDVLNYQTGREVYSDMKPEDAYRDLLQMSESSMDYTTSCIVGISQCQTNEDCVQNFPKTRAGTCKCKQGYMRDREGVCREIVGMQDGQLDLNSPIDDVNTTAPVSKMKLTVTATSKQIKLPENEVSLTAEVSPPPEDGEKYNYEWTSLHKPDGSNAVKQQNAEELHLTKLTEGLYTFKVNVSNEKAYGETFVNVTVLPPSRINQPPKIIITPANQTIKLPNTGAVLDASSSTDDNGIVSYHWELQEGPVGYQPHLADKATLQLDDLSRPGNYTFKLTVTDTDKETSTGIANITVLKVTDYPPDANAGQDVIIYLPHNQVTLNGNLSIDDHMITTWEWTKSPDDADKAVDMQDTRTPYLRLSDLEEGMYTFQLKVTDSANQSSVASIHVFVKPPTNQPPVARTGENITISLPQTWVVVDASNSSDDNKITEFKWEKVEGPSNVVFINVNSSKTKITGLTKGNYVFKITVVDDSKNNATALQYVTVNQNKNQKPKANAGGNFEVELPRNVIYVNGSKSSDDWAIVKWKWTRTDTSLAFGQIAEHSDETAVLILSNILPGKYIFNLTVSDEQGLSDTDSVTITVKHDKNLINLVDITMDVDVKLLTHVQYGSLKGKLALLLQDGSKLQVRSLKSQIGTERAIIRFYVEDAKGVPLGANEVVRYLREKLKVDASLLGFPVARLQTVICQNNCSGHGVCDEVTRKCICEAFWMPDMFKVYLAYEEDSDCSWSILYVVLGVICGVIGLAGSVWGAIYLCLSKCSCRSGQKPTNYKLIENTEDIPSYNPRKADFSDTDSDSDVVFESRNKPSRFNGESRNGHKPTRNGYSKMGRKIKT